jgi:hypothetical protein
MPDLTDINTQTIGMSLDDRYTDHLATQKNILWQDWLKKQPPAVRKKWAGPLDARQQKEAGEFMEMMWTKKLRMDWVKDQIPRRNRIIDIAVDKRQVDRGEDQWLLEKADKEAFEQTEQNLWEAQAMKDKVRRKKEKMNFLKKGGELYPTVPPYSP